MGQSVAALGRDAVAPNGRAVFPCCPLRSLYLLVGPAVRSDVCCQPTTRAIVRLVCIVFFPSAWGRRQFAVVLAPVGTACTLVGLCHCFGWDVTKGVLEAAGTQENSGAGCAVLAMFEYVCYGRGPGASLKKTPAAGLKRVEMLESVGVGHTISKLGRDLLVLCSFPQVSVSRPGGRGGKWYPSSFVPAPPAHALKLGNRSPSCIP